MPTVSVVIPSYNHERFIKECIESILNQTFQDFEIIITDDASGDSTVDAIRSFGDRRIKLFVHERNLGVSKASNNCIQHSRGKYVAIIGSDDAWYPEKLAKQVKFLDEHPSVGAVFGRVDWVDERGQPLTDAGFPFLHLFDVTNRSRFEWLRHFFYQGNCLCEPCSMVRRECYDKVGMYDPSFANLPDFDLWIRICLEYEIHVLDEKLVHFRRIDEQINVSGRNLKGLVRGTFEYKQLLNHYLELQDPQQLLGVFPEATHYGKVTRPLIPYFLARIAVDAGREFMGLWGLELLYNLLKDETTARKLEKQYGFTHQQFRQLTGQVNTFNVAAAKQVEELQALVAAREQEAGDLRAAIQQTQNSKGWKLAQFLQRLRRKLLPPGSLLERAISKAGRLLRPGRQTIPDGANKV